MNKQLLFTLTRKDFEVEFFRGSGKGGQHRNKTDSCCRITHKETGISAMGTEHREQSKNKKLAFERLAANKRFQLFLKQRAGLIADKEKEINDWVEEQMRSENLKIEYL